MLVLVVAAVLVSVLVVAAVGVGADVGVGFGCSADGNHDMVTASLSWRPENKFGITIVKWLFFPTGSRTDAAGAVVVDGGALVAAIVVVGGGAAVVGGAAAVQRKQKPPCIQKYGHSSYRDCCLAALANGVAAVFVQQQQHQ